MNLLPVNIDCSNPEKKPCIDHIDGQKENNLASNLRWVTEEENMGNPVNTRRRPVVQMRTYDKVLGHFSKLTEPQAMWDAQLQKFTDFASRNKNHVEPLSGSMMRRQFEKFQ